MFINRMVSVIAAIFLFAGTLPASDWPSWRGPHQNGVSDETGLISSWSLEGQNLLWKKEFVGRSTPVVLNGRVYVVGRTGDGSTMQRHVACFEAQSGKLIWEEKNNVTHTTVPFNRVGWSSLAADPATGNVYLFGVDGLFICYNKDGKRLWEVSFEEEFNRFSGYGGRTATPIVDEDLVIVNYVNNSWGDQIAQRHRFAAYDTKTGEQIWVSTVNAPPKNTNYSVPVVAMINGVRTLVCGTSAGYIVAMKARTGEDIWKFQLTEGAVQVSVVVAGDRVFAAHSGENIDNAQRGRVVCIDGTGTGDVTKTHEVWRREGLEVGYASPLYHDGRLYVVSNAGNLEALEAETGKHIWTINLGTVGKGSPVWADGKIYATEVNGTFDIIQPGETEAKYLDRKQLSFPGEDRPAEIYGSPAVGYGNVYFTSEVGLFCLGKGGGNHNNSAAKGEMLMEPMADQNASVAHIQIVPSESWIYSDGSINFKIRTFDDRGRRLDAKQAQFSLNGLQGSIDAKGKFTPDKNAGNQAGYVVAKVGELESKSRVAVSTHLPMNLDFQSFEAEKNVPLWPGASKFVVGDFEGKKVLRKDKPGRNLSRHNIYLAPPDMTNYTVQADVKGTKEKRRSPDMGVIANRYYFDFMTKKGKLQLRTWPAMLARFSKQIDYEWNPDLWYTMKLRVDYKDGKGYVKGKIWPRNEQEPQDWTITAEDPIPNRHGSPGLYGDSVTSIYYDNVKIHRSK